MVRADPFERLLRSSDSRDRSICTPARDASFLRASSVADPWSPGGRDEGDRLDFRLRSLEFCSELRAASSRPATSGNYTLRSAVASWR
jgi:hypothetical protein